jgi:hypothetical protein
LVPAPAVVGLDAEQRYVGGLRADERSLLVGRGVVGVGAELLVVGSRTSSLWGSPGKPSSLEIRPIEASPVDFSNQDGLR